MPKLQNHNGRFCESEYESAFLSFLETEGWDYLPGNSIPRNSKRDVLYADDLELFLTKANPDLKADDVQQIIGLPVRKATLLHCTHCMAG